MSMHPTGRHDATRGTYATCGIVLLLAVLLILWAFRGGPFNEPTPSAPTPTPLYVVIVTPDTAPPAVPTGVSTKLVPPPLPTRMWTAVPPAVPTGVPTGVPTKMVLGAIALHDGTVPLFSAPCWARSRNPHPTCTPTPFPPGSPTGTAVPTDTPTPTTAPTGTAVPTGTPCVGPDPYWSCVPTREFELEVGRLINEHRATVHGYAPYAMRMDLSLAERGWAEYMVSVNGCEHGDYGARALEQGYTGWAWGNIGACGYPNPAETVQGWLDSPGHHGIIDECCNMTEFGVGAAQYANGYWSVWSTVGVGGQPEP